MTSLRSICAAAALASLAIAPACPAHAGNPPAEYEPNSNGGWGGGLPAHNGGQGQGSGGGEIDDPGLPAHNADNVKPPPTAQFIPGNPETPISGNRIPPKIHGPNPGPIPLGDPRTQ